MLKVYKNKAGQNLYHLYNTIYNNIKYIVFKMDDGFIGYCKLAEFNKAIKEKYLILVI